MRKKVSEEYEGCYRLIQEIAECQKKKRNKRKRKKWNRP